MLPFVHILTICVMSLVFVFPTSSAAQDKSDNWSVRLDSPFAGPIWRLGLSQDESTLAVSSADETVNTWSLDLELVRKRYAFSRQPHLNYRARAMALGTSGNIIALSSPPIERGSSNGELAAMIELRSAVDGSLVERITGNLPTRPQAMMFSPDGNFLTAVLSEGCGLRIWRTTDWELHYSDDENYGDCNLNEKSTDATEIRFVGDEPLAIVTSGESGLRRYEQTEGSFIRTAFRTTGASLQRPDGIALSPDGKRLAVGDRRVHNPNAPYSVGVRIVDAKTLEDIGSQLNLGDDYYFYEEPNTAISHQVRLHRIAWDEHHITAGGVLPCSGVLDLDSIIENTEVGARTNCLVQWPVEGGGDPRFVAMGDEAVVDLLSVPTQSALAIATRNLITMLDEQGELWVDDYGEVLEEKTPFTDFRPRSGSDESNHNSDAKPLSFDVSADGKKVFWQDYSDETSLSFELANLKLSQPNQPDDELIAPNSDPTIFGAPSTWSRSSSPEFAPADMLLENDILRSVAAFEENRFALVGTADSIQVIDLQNKQVVCRHRVTSEAFRVNYVAEPKLAIVGHGDGTLRWYAVSFDGDTSCAFFEKLAVNVRRASGDAEKWTWHAWIKGSGQFASDALAKPDMTWQRSGKFDDVELVEFSSVPQLYNRDAIINALYASNTKDTPDIGAELLDSAKDARQLSVELLLPTGRAAVRREPDVELTLQVEGEGTWPKSIDLRVGRKASVEKVFEGRTYQSGQAIEISGPGTYDVTIKLPEHVRHQRGQFDICFYEDEKFTGSCATLAWNGEIVPRPKPKLWAVLIGWSDYSKSRLSDLKYAQNDALDIARLLVDDKLVADAKPGTRDYSGLHIDLIVAPTTAHAKAEIEELSKLSFVSVHEPNPGSVENALAKLIALDEREALANDVLLLAYSGHGISVREDSVRNTLLLGPNAGDDLQDTLKTNTALPIRSLMDSLVNISAEQIILIDACRSFSQVELSTTIDPAFENIQLSARGSPANVVFSARVGQYSPETSRFSFSNKRPDRTNGNGIFAFAVLDSLTNPEADTIKGKSSANRIEVDEVKAHLRNFFEGRAGKYFDRVRKVIKSFIPRNQCGSLGEE